MNIHVTNLHLNLVESDLRRMFTPYGEVQSVNLVRDKINHRQGEEPLLICLWISKVKKQY